MVEQRRRLQRDADRRKQGEREPKVDRDAADARLRLDVHAPLVGDVDHADVLRELANERRHEQRGDRRDRERDSEQEEGAIAHGTRSSEANGANATPASASNAVAYGSG